MVSDRYIFALFPLILFAICGCVENPTAEFVSTELSQDLVRQASRAIDDTIDERFGDPQNLVAWLKLPVNFGEIKGEVLDGVGASLSSVKVRFTETPDDWTPEELKGAGLQWLSGNFAGPITGVDKRGREFPIAFHIDGYKPEKPDNPNAGTLSIDPSPNIDQQPALQKGDQFVIVGHTFRRGRKLYMRYCMHCHGVSGDGNGPTAKYLNPRPRDYRPGLFKFTSTGVPNHKPNRDDLRRIVKLGIPGTYMPSFMLLKVQEADDIVEYVRWLSMRGQIEDRVANEFKLDFSKGRLKEDSRDEVQEEFDTFMAEDFSGYLNDGIEFVVAAWNNVADAQNVVNPSEPHTPSSTESIARGRKLFLGQDAGCSKCHGVSAKGNGPANIDFNDIPGTTTKSDKPGLFDNWGNIIKPRNLTTGIYRGGRRPLDLYRRIKVGIKGTPMPSANVKLKDSDIWDLVNYVLSVPFQDGPPDTSKLAGHSSGKNSVAAKDKASSSRDKAGG